MASADNGDTSIKDDQQQASEEEETTPDKNPKRKKEEDEEEELERLARESLIRDAKRNKMRAEQNGASGWYDFPRPKTNKRFAKAIVKSAVIGNSLKRRSKQ